MCRQEEPGGASDAFSPSCEDRATLIPTSKLPLLDPGMTRERRRPPRGRPFRSTSAVHLLGAFSNPEVAERVEALTQLRKRILAKRPASPLASSTPPRRIGDVPKAISKALEQAETPLHTTAIHRAVEQSLGRPVNYRTIKACLSADAQTKNPRFERTARGKYQLI
jgi:hypothetical protein